MTKTCPQCQAPILETQRFCRYCGHRVDQGLQDYVETETFEKPSPPGRPRVPQQPMDPEWPLLAGKETTPLVKSARGSRLSGCLDSFCCLETNPLMVRAQRSKVLYGFLSLILLCALGVGFFRFYQPESPAARVIRDVPGSRASAGPITPPLPPAAPSPPSLPKLAPPPLPPVAPRSPRAASGQQIYRQISRMLSNHAARIQRQVQQLQRQLNRTAGLSDQERQALRAQVKALEEQRLGVLAAAHALNSQELQNVLKGVVPLDDVLKEVEAELKRQNINLDISDIDALLDRQ